MIPALAAILIALSGCEEPKDRCIKYDTITEIGQCAARTYEVPVCVAMTRDGHKVQGENPYVVGERVCVMEGKP